METFVTADLHLGETRLELMGRPFKTTKDMWKAIRDRHNAVVASNDLVIINGDAVSRYAPDALEWVARIKELNGIKDIVRGNHEEAFTDEQLKTVFRKVIPHGQGIETDIVGADGEKIPLYITHYPIRSRVDRFNLTGHIHDRWKCQLNMLNVGVDVHHFAPMNIKKAEFFLTAIEKYYDDDVWVGDHPANAAYKAVRGNKSNDFETLTREG